MLGSQSHNIVDLGGVPQFWDDCPRHLNITIVNLPGATEQRPSHHSCHMVEGDACALPFLADKSFEIAFSNSVIEHVGDEARQEAFVAEVRRLGRGYCVLTPCMWFPIEAHTGMPLWWQYPESVRQQLIAKWRKTLPAWADYIAGTRVLTEKRMRTLFPDGEIYIERMAGLPKSITAYCPS